MGIRTYLDAKILGYKRSKRNQYSSISLIKIDGLESRKHTNFYSGKRVVFVYKAHNLSHGTKIRSICGKVARAHGNSGVLRVNFRRNLPPSALGSTCRVMLYPSRI